MSRQENIKWLENRIIALSKDFPDRKVRYPLAVKIARSIGVREATAKDYVQTIVKQGIFGSDGYSFIVNEDQEPSPMNPLLKKNSTLNEIVKRIETLEKKMDYLLEYQKEHKRNEDSNGLATSVILASL